MIESLNRPIWEVQTLASTPGCPALMQRTNIDGNEYIFLKGVTNGIYGAWVTFDEVGVTTLLAANAIGQCAILMGGGAAGATVAAYGVPDAATKGVWALISGSAYSKVLAAFADNGNMYATATAGSADDAVVAGDRIKNAIGRSAINGNGYALTQVWYPFMDDGLAA